MMQCLFIPMSITVTIALIAPVERIPELAEAVSARIGGLAPRGLVWTEEAGPEELDVPATPNERVELLSKTLDSDQAVVMDCLFSSSRATKIGTAIRLTGRRFHLGYPWRGEGPLTVEFSMSDLAEGYLQDRYGHPAPPPGTEDVAIENAQELFSVVSGALDSGDEVVRPDHAAMYIEGTMRPPAACAMVYHRTLRDFARDARRTWLELTQGRRR
jgi:hypothetical protein